MASVRSKQSLLKGLHRRMPAVFGPFPGPRQAFNGKPRDGSRSTSVEAFITFRTRQSALQNLLPRGFAFQQKSEEAFVSLASKRLDNLDWLAGRGYNLFSVYIHGIEYAAAGGKIHQGTFLPILWENMADPILSGREELGFPKLFADIDIRSTDSSYSSSLSWEGSCFATFELPKLEEQSSDMGLQLAPKDAGIHDGILLHRYIPATGQPGVAETDCAVFVPYAEEKKVQESKITRLFTAPRGKFTWNRLSWESLPTLHHIVARLEEIPVLETVQCGMVEKIGVPDFSSARKID